jgi:hypothetical protein
VSIAGMVSSPWLLDATWFLEKRLT